MEESKVEFSHYLDDQSKISDVDRKQIAKDLKRTKVFILLCWVVLQPKTSNCFFNRAAQSHNRRPKLFWFRWTKLWQRIRCSEFCTVSWSAIPRCQDALKKLFAVVGFYVDFPFDSWATAREWTILCWCCSHSWPRKWFYSHFTPIFIHFLSCTVGLSFISKFHVHRLFGPCAAQLKGSSPKISTTLLRRSFLEWFRISQYLGWHRFFLQDDERFFGGKESFGESLWGVFQVLILFVEIYDSLFKSFFAANLLKRPASHSWGAQSR